MNLLDEKNNIIMLEDEIKSIEEKRKKLNELRNQYYMDYFNFSRDEYALLTDIPENCTGEKHILYDHSNLNVDVVGDAICQLFFRYEHKIMTSKRVNSYMISVDGLNIECQDWPMLVITELENAANAPINCFDDRNNIFIRYNQVSSIKKYPTDNIVKWSVHNSNKKMYSSNYNELLYYRGGLSFNYKDYEFIKELIYSLAYYQKQNDINYMDADKTYDVFKKIYRKNM